MATFILRPNGIGAYNEWVRFSGNNPVPHFEAVDEVSPDENTTFLEHFLNGAAGARESFQFQKRTLTNITGVRFWFRARREAAEAVTGAALLRLVDTDITGTQQALTGSYVDYSQLWATSPFSGGAWTMDELRRLEAGVAGGSSVNDRIVITQVWLEITADLPPLGGDVWGTVYGPSDAAVVVNQASGTVAGGASSGTIANFNCSGDDRLLIVDVCHDNDNLAPVVFQITRLGQALTFLRGWGTWQANQRIERWYLVNPIAGNGTITVDFGGGNNLVGIAVTAAIACSGVDQANPFGADLPVFGGIQSASPSGTIQAPIDTLVIDGWVSQNLTAGATPGTNQTQILDLESTGGGATVCYLASWERSAGGGTTMSWTAADPSSAWKAGVATAIRGARRGLVPLGHVSDVRAVEGVGKFGAAIFSTKYTAEINAEAIVGREVGLYSEGWGENWFGKITDRQINVKKDEDLTVEFTAVSLAKELGENPTYIGIVTWPENFTAQAALNEILRYHELGAPTIWSGILTGTGFVNVTDRWDNMSIWQALQQFAEAQNALLRETGPRQVELTRTLRDTGMVITNPDALRPEADSPNIGILEGDFTIKETGQHIANRVSAVGVDAGKIVLDLSLSNRSTPNVIKQSLRNRPTWTRAQEFFPIREDGGHKNVASINVVGEHRGMIVFGITPYLFGAGEDGSWFDVGGQELPAGGAAASTNNFTIRGWYFDGIPAGEVRLAVDVPESFADPGSDTSFICIPLQDSGPWLANTLNAGFGTSAGAEASGLQTGGELVIACVLTEGNGHVFFDASWQQRIYTGGGGNIAISYFFAQQPTDGILWGIDSADDWTVFTITVRPKPVFYIEDVASIEQYGRKAEFKSENANKFSSAIGSALTNAANTLYDREAAHLDHHKAPQRIYEGVKCTLPLGPKDWLVGDALRLRYHQSDPTLSIDEVLYCLERTQTYDVAGARHWSLTLSNEPAFPKNEVEIFNETLSRLLALEGLE